MVVRVSIMNYQAVNSNNMTLFYYMRAFYYIGLFIEGKYREGISYEGFKLQGKSSEGFKE